MHAEPLWGLLRHAASRRHPYQRPQATEDGCGSSALPRRRSLVCCLCQLPGGPTTAVSVFGVCITSNQPSQ